MKSLNEKTAEVLNDLIQINNDRIRGYEKAAEETNVKDADLRSLFSEMIDESRLIVSELSSQVLREGEELAEGTTIKGKIYRAWMDVKASFSGNNRKTILASCEFGEDAAQKAYTEALNEDIPSDIRLLLTQQKSVLKSSHDKIKRMRDAQTA
jgi:uncharacterized protein (TIGR02284 family)